MFSAEVSRSSVCVLDRWIKWHNSISAPNCKEITEAAQVFYNLHTNEISRKHLPGVGHTLLFHNEHVVAWFLNETYENTGLIPKWAI